MERVYSFDKTEEEKLKQQEALDSRIAAADAAGMFVCGIPAGKEPGK